MASRKVALIGAASGPWIHTGSMMAPHLKIVGLGEARVTAESRKKDDSTEEQVFCENGTHPLGPMEWVRLRCAPRQPKLICEIVSGRR